MQSLLFAVSSSTANTNTSNPKRKRLQNLTNKKTKEIQLRIAIDEHDYGIKLARAERFLAQGDKLVVQLRFRGRENAHKDLGFDLMKKVCDNLGTMGKVDLSPNLRGKRITMTLSPLPKHQQKRQFDKHLKHLSEEALASDEGDVDEEFQEGIEAEETNAADES